MAGTSLVVDFSIVRKLVLLVALPAIGMALPAHAADSVASLGDNDTAVVSEQNTSDEPGSEPVEPQTDEAAQAFERIAQIGFTTPAPSAYQDNRLGEVYNYVDGEKLIPSGLRRKALAYYHENYEKIPNQHYVTVADFSQHSSKPRLFIINMATGSVWQLHVAHGKGSDPGNSGLPDRFSNEEGTDATSLGFYLTGETYYGEHKYSMRLDGLSKTNSNVRRRNIVIHGADYVHDSDIKAGRSWGCLAVSFSDRDEVINKLRDGSLIYAAGPDGEDQPLD